MNCLELTNIFDTISEEYLNGEIGDDEAVEALDYLYANCEKSIKDILTEMELNALSGLLVEIADFENALVDKVLLEVFEADDMEPELYESSSEEEAEEIIADEPIEEEPVYFADSEKEYEAMRNQWRKNRESERKTAIKTEREIPLEERYKAAMGAFKDMQEDKAQAWKLKDEAKWLVQDLNRWQKESYEWMDIFKDYYAKLGNEIARKSKKLSSDYKTPITEEDINITDQLDDSENNVVPEEIIDDSEETAEESSSEESQQEVQKEQVSEETSEQQPEVIQEQGKEGIKNISAPSGEASQE